MIRRLFVVCTGAGTPDWSFADRSRFFCGGSRLTDGVQNKEHRGSNMASHACVHDCLALQALPEAAAARGCGFLVTRRR